MDVRFNTTKNIRRILVPGLLKNTTFNLFYYLIIFEKHKITFLGKREE